MIAKNIDSQGLYYPLCTIIAQAHKILRSEVILSNVWEIAEIVHINPLFLPVSGINGLGEHP